MTTRRFGVDGLESQRLKGRVAIISGGLRGIGLAIAERYLAEGAQVVLSDLDGPENPFARETLARLGSAASYVSANVASEADWERLRKVVQDRHDRCDILVNNAGTDLHGAVETLDLEHWRRLMAINVDGVFLGTKIFVPMLAAAGGQFHGGSSIINISSVMGLVGSAGVSAYNASKGAVRLFTKGIAVEFSTKKTPIRANSIHPGFVTTPLLQAGFQRWIDQGVVDNADVLVKTLSAKTPMGRLADPSEIAGAAFFLASEDSSYMTGSEVVVDGGWTAQ
jgi:NAD(P)-dependent dehydrogenase (short-subunit alcohol dehydrogenase family)